VPLSATGWHADRALGATEWYGRARRPGVRVPSPSRLPRPRGVFATGDVRAAGGGALRELSSVFDRAAGWAGWLVPLPLRDVTG